MPEGIEVIITALYLNHKLKNQELTNIKINNGRYIKKDIPGLSKLEFPLTIKKVKSKGKFMWIELQKNNEPIYLFNTFGMTGLWSFENQNHAHIQFTINDTKTKKTTQLYFVDSQRFGTISITDNPLDLSKKLLYLGEDMIRIQFTSADLEDRIEKIIKTKNDKYNSRADKNIYKILMDQTQTGGIGSGLGNYLVSNILYKAKISPHTTLKTIYESDKLIKYLSDAIKWEVKVAFMTENDGYIKKMDTRMQDFLNRLRSEIKKNPNHKYNFHPDVKIGRTKFKFHAYGNKNGKDVKGNPIQRDIMIKNGKQARAAYWVPNVQIY